MSTPPSLHSPKAAARGEPSYVWRAGQDRRLDRIASALGERLKGRVLDNGCGVGMYVERLSRYGGNVTGLEYEFDRCKEACLRSDSIVNAAGEALPFPDECFDAVLSHEVLEHVLDDRLAAAELARVLRPGGRLALFVPNRGYPVETHGIYWCGSYRFGNIPLVNYLPRRWRDRLAPHVRVYTAADLKRLFSDLPLRPVQKTVIFGAYDNIIARRPRLGQLLRGVLLTLERTPFRLFGISHFWVMEKVE